MVLLSQLGMQVARLLIIKVNVKLPENRFRTILSVRVMLHKLIIQVLTKIAA